MPDSLAAETERFHSLDLMSTLVAVLRSDGAVQFANAALENTLGLSRRTLEGADFSSFFTDPALLQTALAGARGNVDARIFMQQMAAELVSIAGVYRTLEEDMPETLHERAVQVSLDGSKLVLAAMAVSG